MGVGRVLGLQLICGDDLLTLPSSRELLQSSRGGWAEWESSLARNAHFPLGKAEDSS